MALPPSSKVTEPDGRRAGERRGVGRRRADGRRVERGLQRVGWRGLSDGHRVGIAARGVVVGVAAVGIRTAAYVPASVAVIVQVATPLARTVAELHEVAPALPETFHATEPVGVIPLTPMTVAVVFTVPLYRRHGPESLDTTLVCVALATFTVSVLLDAEVYSSSPP